MSRITNGSKRKQNHDQIRQAALFAIQAHRGQIRKIGGQPYFFHPLAVGRILLEAGLPSEVITAGILHDTVEDTPTTPSEIAALFGDRVAGWVVEVTEPEKPRPWRIRKQAYLERIAAADDEVIMISMADKLDNLRSLEVAIDKLGSAVWDKFTKPEPDQRWYYQSLVDIYSERTADISGSALLSALQESYKLLFDQ